MSYLRFSHQLRREVNEKRAAFLRRALEEAETVSAAARACGIDAGHFRRDYFALIGNDELFRSRAAAGRRAGRPRKAGR